MNTDKIAVDDVVIEYRQIVDTSTVMVSMPNDMGEMILTDLYLLSADDLRRLVAILLNRLASRTK